jgi:hypothetical protein
MAVEGLCFETNLGDELALKKTLEILRIRRLWLGKHALVDELVDFRALHLVDRWLLLCSSEGVVASEGLGFRGTGKHEGSQTVSRKRVFLILMMYLGGMSSVHKSATWLK